MEYSFREVGTGKDSGEIYPTCGMTSDFLVSTFPMNSDSLSITVDQQKIFSVNQSMEQA